MPLVTVRDLHLRFRGPPLLDGVTCHIEPGQRIGLLGRNGAGKTSLLRILAGVARSDAGDVTFQPGATVALLPQDVPRDLAGAIRDIVATGLPPVDADHEAAWRRDHAVDQVLSRMSLDGDRHIETLSSGMKRRVLLARALVAAPDLLLLDEPTNHLDVDAVEWLEEFLGRWPGTLVFVTHDRTFLRHMAGRILEIDRGRIFDWSCDYDTFLLRKEAALAAEERQQALFDTKLAQEEVWIRTGIKARRTRNEGRVRALEAMRRERAARRDAVGRTRLQIQEAERSGALVAKADGISFARDGRPIIRDFSATVMRGDRIGVIGPNGAGKTTLLRLLLGTLEPSAGSVRRGTNLQVAYFDQLREQLDDDKTVADNVSDGSETVHVGGQARHVIGYLQDFLFAPERTRTAVRFLSGGERQRVLLARLVEFSGTVLLVSHDRAFLDNVVTSTLVFESAATGGPDAPAWTIREYVGGYADWLRQRPTAPPGPALRKPERATASAAASSPPPATPLPTRRKLSFKEQQELAALPGRIEALETDIAARHAAMAAPDYYRQPGDALAREQRLLAAAEEELATAYARWEALDGPVT